MSIDPWTRPAILNCALSSLSLVQQNNKMRLSLAVPVLMCKITNTFYTIINIVFRLEIRHI